MEEIKKHGTFEWDDRWDTPAMIYFLERGRMCNAHNHDCSICPMRNVSPIFDNIIEKAKKAGAYESDDVATRRGICSGFEETNPFKATEIVADWARLN